MTYNRFKFRGYYSVSLHNTHTADRQTSCWNEKKLQFNHIIHTTSKKHFKPANKKNNLYKVLNLIKAIKKVFKNLYLLNKVTCKKQLTKDSYKF